ncbi:hypothetical protein [Halorussus sp. AFM4]|uniref:hypothetical protein n=1 Tax=Halorussus sp. AFM4 TaxID=3421651 RepID=UPI003EBC6C2C
MNRLLLSSVGLLILTATVGATITDTQTGDETPLPANETKKLWSLDDDNYVNESAYRAQTGQNQTDIGAYLNVTDWVWSRPPVTAAIWNRNDFASFADSFSPSPTESVYPENAVLVEGDRGWIEDAHATIYRAQPTTRVHLNQSTTRHYIRPEGRLFGLVDYRLNLPAEDDNGADGKKVLWELSDHGITKTCVLQGRTVGPDASSTCGRSGARIGTGSGSHTANISYDVRGTGSFTTSLTFAAVIEYSVVKTVKTRHSGTYEECRTVHVDGESRFDCDQETRTWWETAEKVITDRVVVSDTLDPVTVYDLKAAVQTAKTAEGTTSFIIQTQQLWAGATIDNRAQISTQWRFYTARDPDWDSFIVESNSDPERKESSLRPARVFAFPSSRGMSTNTTGNTPHSASILKRLEGQNRTSPNGTLANSLDLPVAADTYNDSRSVAIEYQNESGEVEADGIVRGVTSGGMEIGGTAEIRQTNLTLDVVASNSSHVTVRAVLQEKNTSDSIDLRSRSGYLFIEGHKVNTNASGIVLVTLEKKTTIQAKFRPGEWWEAQPGYTESQARAVTNSDFLTVDTQAEFWVRVFVYSLPIIVPFYFLDQLPGVSAWPPWKPWK